MNLLGKDLICSQDWSLDELMKTVELAEDMQKNRFSPKYTDILAHKTFFMFFYNPSVRTRQSFECAGESLGSGAAVNPIPKPYAAHDDPEYYLGMNRVVFGRAQGAVYSLGAGRRRQDMHEPPRLSGRGMAHSAVRTPKRLEEVRVSGRTAGGEQICNVSHGPTLIGEHETAAD